MYLLPLPHLTDVAVAHHTVWCFVTSLFLSTKIHLLEFFTVFPLFHQVMKTGYTLQSCVHLFSLLLDCACSCVSHKTFIHHCSFRCQLTRFLTTLTCVVSPLQCCVPWRAQAESIFLLSSNNAIPPLQKFLVGLLLHHDYGAIPSRVERLYAVMFQVDSQTLFEVQDGFVCVADLEILMFLFIRLPVRKHFLMVQLLLECRLFFWSLC